MLTTLALCLLAPQGGAALHPAQADLFVELPDLQGFARAWQSSAVPAMLEDEELAPALSILGSPSLSDLEAQLPPEVRAKVLPLLEAVRGVSFSAQLDLATLDTVVQESVVTYQIATALDALEWTAFMGTGPDGTPPESLEPLCDSPSDLIDPFGNPYVYSVDGTEFHLVCLGADGEPGGVGLNADWDSRTDPAPYLIAQACRLAGLELVVEWSDPAAASQVAQLVEGLMAKLSEQLPFAKQSALGTGDSSRSVSIDPADLGVNGIESPIEFSFLMEPELSVFAIGQTRGSRIAARLDALRAGELADDCLAASDSYQQSMGRVSNDRGTVLWQGVAKGIDLNSSREEPPGTLGDAMEKARTLLGLVGLEDSAWQTRIVDGRYVTDAFRAGAQGTGKLDRVASLVPDDAALVHLAKVSPSAAWEFMNGLVEVDGDKDLDKLRERLGVDIEHDLLGHLGSEYALWFLPVTGLAPPSAFVVFPVDDREAVMGAMNRLSDLIVSADDSFRVSRRPYRGVEYTTLDVGIPIGFRPSFAVIDDVLWLSNSSTLLKRVIRQEAKGELPARGNHPLLATLRGADGAIDERFESGFFADVGSMIAAYYGAGRTLAGMIPPSAGVPPGLIASLPEPGFFARHIGPSTSWTRYQDGGLMTHSEGAFGPEPIVLGASVAASLLVLSSSRVVVGDFEAEAAASAPVLAPMTVSNREQLVTQQALGDLELALLVFSIENGHDPERLEQLLDSSKAYPGGYLKSDALPLDGWGRAFVYSRGDDTGYALYSRGPNGEDDGGAGDDLVSP